MPPKKQAYKRPVSIPIGTVIGGTGKKWVVGSPIGRGGFGDIYLAAECAAGGPAKRDADYTYAIKIEPSENGPLFVERMVYVQIGKEEKVVSWMTSRGLKSLGMPILRGWGQHDVNGLKHRFVVIDRFSKDLHSLFLQNKKVFPLITVLRIALQIHDVLEYIHSHNYVHADIKGANLLFGLKRGTENQVYLVDFGLACKYKSGEYKKDPKKAHNGTLEYTSRDAHFGVPTRRGDYEVLAYNMIHWLASTLPWEHLKDVVAVERSKLEEMKNVPAFLKKCFGKRPVPGVLSSFVELIAQMEPKEAPDYDKIKKLFVGGITALNGTTDGPLQFRMLNEEQENIPVKTKKIRASPYKRGKPALEDDGRLLSSEPEDEDSPTQSKRTKRTSKKPINTLAKAKRSKKGNLETLEEPISKQGKQNKATMNKLVESKTKPSWRDCATAQASKVTQAGQYVSSNPKRVKKC